MNGLSVQVREGCVSLDVIYSFSMIMPSCDWICSIVRKATDTSDTLKHCKNFHCFRQTRSITHLNKKSFYVVYFSQNSELDFRQTCEICFDIIMPHWSSDVVAMKHFHQWKSHYKASIRRRLWFNALKVFTNLLRTTVEVPHMCSWTSNSGHNYFL